MVLWFLGKRAGSSQIGNKRGWRRCAGVGDSRDLVLGGVAGSACKWVGVWLWRAGRSPKYVVAQPIAWRVEVLKMAQWTSSTSIINLALWLNSSPLENYYILGNTQGVYSFDVCLGMPSVFIMCLLCNKYYVLVWSIILTFCTIYHPM